MNNKIKIPGGGRPAPETEVCLFCEIVKGRQPAYVIAENENVLAILDIYPATPGHTLVLPKQHYENIYVLSNEIASCLMEITLMAAVAIRSQLNPQGLNLVQANGRAAGQTVNHFHIHLVPRFKDDKVILEYGHLPVRAGAEELASMAARIKQGLLPNT